MRIKYLTKRRQVYWYRRHIPTALEHVLGTGLYQVSLHTGDLRTAIGKAEGISLEWETMRVDNRPSSLYRQALKDITEYPEHVVDALSEAPEEDKEEVFKALPVIDQVTFRAAQEKLGERSRDPAFSYSLMDGVNEIIKIRKDDVEPKTLAKYHNSAAHYLGDLTDLPLGRITKKDVRLRLDDLKVTKSHQTRTDYLSYLSQVFEFAVEREYIPEGINPFKGVKHGKAEKLSYKRMKDDTLSEILKLIEPEHRLAAYIARYSGMRLSEIFESTLVEEEGILCFRVAPSEVYKGAKTEAGNRMVPVRDSLRSVVEASHGDLKNHQAYSKRFGRAKRKVVGDRRDIAFHSLRVQFITLALRAGFSEMQVAWLVGHEEGKGDAMTGQLYHKGYSLQTLKEIVEAVPVMQLELG